MPVRAKAKSAKGTKGKCDVLFSLLIRARGECEACGERDYRKLQTAHIVGRTSSWTRTDFDNAFCLCGRCHYIFTDHPFAWVAFVENKRPGEYERMDHKAKEGIGVKFDWDIELMRLTRVATRVFPGAPASYTPLIAWLKSNSRAGVS